jgi:hypothetical protein
MSGGAGDAMSLFRSLLKRLFGPGLAWGAPQAPKVAAPPLAVINGVALTKDEQDGSVAEMTEPPKQQQSVEQPASCHILKLIGYWAPLSHSYSGHRAYAQKQPPWPDIRRAVRVGWRATERDQLAAYLRNGHRCNGALGFSACRFECRVTYSILGSGELTDGEWIWPEGLPHYVERHGVMLPGEFVASASAQAWKVPPIDEVGAKVPSALYYSGLRGWMAQDGIGTSGQWKVDYSFWLEWAKGLPEVPEVQPHPDPGALERFCLVMQYLDTEELDEQMEGFYDNIWDKVEEQYGRYRHGVEKERYIEWISVNHRDAVVALVLDGLRRHELKDRVTIIRSAPDPNDWQRDRDVTLWPQKGAAEQNTAPDRGHDTGSS